MHDQTRPSFLFRGCPDALRSTLACSLSYTEFDVKWATPPPALITVGSPADTGANYSVTVSNIGQVAGDEVVLAFTVPKAHTLRASLGDAVPIEKKKLFGFQRVSLAAGASVRPAANPLCQGLG